MTSGCSKDQWSGWGPLQLKNIGVWNPEREQGVGLQQWVEMGQTVSSCTHKQVPENTTRQKSQRPKTHVKQLQISSIMILKCHLWNGEQWMECTGPLRGLKEKTAGALSVTLWPSEGTVASIWEEKEHRSSRPPSEPTRKVSGSHGDKAREVTPTVLLPRALGQNKNTCVFHLLGTTWRLWQEAEIWSGCEKYTVD